LTTLGERVQRRVMRQAVSAAATPITKAARAKAPKESGLLRKSMGKKVKTYPKTMTVVGIVGPKTSIIGEHKGRKRWPAKYARLIERGHIARDGSFVPPQPFLGPAMAETQGTALDTMKGKVAEGVIREATKGAAKT
jgi:HK97 gp10 family phage protein